MTQSKHTPTPWELRPENDRHIRRAGAPEGMGVAVTACQFKEDAAFILLAANHHDEMLKILKEIHEYGYDSTDYAKTEALLNKLGAQ